MQCYPELVSESLRTINLDDGLPKQVRHDVVNDFITND
jgi:hypothetical protein